MRARWLTIVLLCGGCTNLPDLLSLLELTKNRPAQPAQLEKGSEFGARAVFQELVRKSQHPERHSETLAYHPAAQLSDKQIEMRARWLNSGRRSSNPTSTMVFRPSETKTPETSD
jgi:hypothetical protein